MRRWPTSLPDYAWPQHLLRGKYAIARVLLAAVFYAAATIGWLLSLVDRQRDRVLVIRTDGLGDALLSEPMLHSLQKSLAPRKIHLWAPKLTCDLLRHCPAVHRLMEIPRGAKAGNMSYFSSFKWRIKLGFAMGFWSFDKVIYPAESPEPMGNWLLTSVRSHERWLNAGDTINQFDWQRHRTHERATRILHRSINDKHELDRNEHLSRQWSRKWTLGPPRVHLTQDIQLRAWRQISAWRALAKARGGEELVGVIPAASMALNSYPESRWIAALRQLWERTRAVPVLLGGPDNQQTLDQLQDALNRRHIPSLRLKSPVGILEMAALVAQMEGVISVDTGLAHLAVAQKVPTVVLVGGGDPGRFFPWPDAPHHIALNHAVPCAGCHNRCTQSEAICITKIEPDQIVWAYLHLRRGGVTLKILPDTEPLRVAG